MTGSAEAAAEAFQSTLPVWGATPSGCPFWASGIFQSTLPVWGATDYNEDIKDER